MIDDLDATATPATRIPLFASHTRRRLLLRTRPLVAIFSLSLAACSSTLMAVPEDVPAPDAIATDASTRDVLAPDASTADAIVSDVQPRDVTAPDVTAPDVTAPDVIEPDVIVPDVPPPIDVVEPPDAAARDLSSMGPHRVALWTGAITGTEGGARVFYPMTAGAEPFPLVAFAHGFQLGVNNYDRLLAHIASWGYVVASVNYPGTLLGVDHRNVGAALSATRRAFMGGGPSGFPASASVDAARAVAMGHSLGGKGAIMALLDDAGFVAGLALDPVDDNPAPLGRITDATPSIAPERMPTLRRPLGLFGATQSRCVNLGTACAPESGDYRQFAAAAPAGASLAIWPLRDFGHMNFVDPGCGFICGTCANGASPLDSRLAALRELSVSFLERFTRGDTSVDSAIRGARRYALVRAGFLCDRTSTTLPACR